MIDYLAKFRLDNRVAYIIGGMGLIGREVSSACAMAGAKTIVLDVNRKSGETFEKELRKKGFDVTFRYFDCADLEHLDESFSRVLNKFKSPQVFINCAYPRTSDWAKASFEEVSLEALRKNVDINMNSYVWLARLAAEAMVAAGEGGSIVQLGSIYGIVGQDLTVYENTDMRENVIYATIKGGIHNLTRQMASYYGRHNIRVNTLCPGGVAGHVAGKSDTQGAEFVRNYSRKTPMKRLGRADEIAATALFLASEAATYITGATIMVDGGWTAV